MTLPSVSPAAPIGIFDSGLGGLTVLRQVQRLLPGESVLYLADTANVPYGDKPLSVVRDLALRLTEHLVRAGAKLVIMASGTSTVAGLDAAQARYPDLPILGTIDVGARVAVAATDNPIGVLATNATVQSRAFTQAVQRLCPAREVIEQGCPRFVPLVESGQAETPDALDAAREYLSPLLAAGVGAVILGCTHFPFLLPVLQRVAAESLPPNRRPNFVDPAEEVVREACDLLPPWDETPTPGDVQFAATGDPDEFRHYAGLLLRRPIPPVTSLCLPPLP